MMMILQMKLSRQYLLIRCLILLASASSSPDTNDNAIPNPFNPPKVSGPRSSRFPSIETRVKLYMSNWYAPSCSGYTDGLAKYEYRPAVDSFNWTRLWVEEPSSVVNHSSYELESAIEPDKAFFIEQGTLLDCSIRGDGDEKYNNRIVFRSNMYMYCLDASNLLLPAVKHILMEGGDTQRRLQSSSTTEAADFLASYPPIVMQFGDLKHSHVYRFMNLPHFKKFRSAAVSSAALSKVTEVDCYDKSRDVLDAFHKDDDGNPFLHPIVWKLATRRHYRFLESVLEEDIPWNNKTNMAVFSGQLTGSRDGFQKKMPDEENCMNMRRCRLVYTHGNSSLVYARLTNTRGRLPDVLNGVELVAESVGIGELLKYKGIVMLEGNGKNSMRLNVTMGNASFF